MSDKEDNNTLTVKPSANGDKPKTLQLTKTVQSGKIQQSFGHGKSRTVKVEVKKTRTFSRDQSGKLIKERAVATDNATPADVNDDNSNLTKSEQENRLKILKQAKKNKADNEQDESDIQNSDQDVQGDSKDQEVEDNATGQPRIIENKKVELSRSDVLKVIAEAPPAPKEEASSISKVKSHRGADKKKGEDSKLHLSHKPKSKIGNDGAGKKRKLTISNAFDQDDRMRSLAATKRRLQKIKKQTSLENGEIENKIRDVVLPETIQVQELANRMAARSTDVIKELMKLGIMGGTDYVMDADTAEIIVTEFGHKFKRVTDADVEKILLEEVVDEKDLEKRYPIVTIMGHVDHGKTSLLDTLRKTDVTAGEAGGITQHIGAYHIQTANGEHVTFLDTPGHAAFTSMRQRGADVTDIVVLIVAADDGVMPQTVEAISHAKAAEVPIIVAINKIDKPEANIDKVKNDLLQHELIPEDLGGTIQVVEISAKENIGLDKLIEAIDLQAEILELKASHKQNAVGAVVEAKLDKGRGVVTTLLVQRGTLKNGDIVVAGTGFGKVRAMTNDKNDIIEFAGPSIPIEITGLSAAPQAGDSFATVTTEKQAREIIEYREKSLRDTLLVKRASVDDEDSMAMLFTNVTKAGKKNLNLIIKGDVQGSIEAIMHSLEKLNNEEVDIKFVHTNVGAISESDISLAAAVNATIVAFNTRASQSSRQMAEDQEVKINYYSIIYNVIDDVKASISGMMKPTIREKFLGNSEIQQIFKMSKYGKVAGCIVREGLVKRASGVRLIRDGVVIHEGKLKTLKRFKDDVQEVKEGFECGMAFENYEDMKDGDIIEAFELIEEARVLD